MDTVVSPNTALPAGDRRAREYLDEPQPGSQASGVSWAAILAGAVGAAILTLILMLLGTGLGLSALSPWQHEGITAKSLGVSTIVWVTITQILAAVLAGYLAGRLRTKWVGLHTDEVYFRDTAHGFLAWAVASLAVASLLASTAGAVLAGGAKAGATVGGAVAGSAAATAGTAASASGSGTSGTTAGGTAGNSGPTAYFIDVLFRPAPGQAGTAAGGNTASAANGGSAAASSPAAGGDSAQLAEATRIFANGLASGSLPPADANYLGQLVAQRTGVSQQDADTRVNDTFAALQARIHEAETAAARAADATRKATAYAALWLTVSLLIGAFVASWAAAFAGRLRDASSISHA